MLTAGTRVVEIGLAVSRRSGPLAQGQSDAANSLALAELLARARRWEALGETERLRFEQRAAAYRSLPPLQRALWARAGG